MEIGKSCTGLVSRRLERAELAGGDAGAVGCECRVGSAGAASLGLTASGFPATRSDGNCLPKT